jgi:hypothetical protein
MVAQIFYHLVDAEHSRSLAQIAARRAYGTLTAIQAQRLAIEAAYKVRIPNEIVLQNRIAALLETARTEANKRNNVAHGIIYCRFVEGTPRFHGRIWQR